MGKDKSIKIILKVVDDYAVWRRVVENQLEAEDLGETITGVLAGNADDVAIKA